MSQPEALVEGEASQYLRPIVFGSRKLNIHEIHYTITEKELLAFVEGVKQSHIYTYGRKFKAFTDHRALIFLMNKKDIGHGRLMRWILALQAYDFDLCYIPGEKNHIPDFGSRVPVEFQPVDEASINLDDCFELFSMLAQPQEVENEGIEELCNIQQESEAQQMLVELGAYWIPGTTAWEPTKEDLAWIPVC